MQQESFTFAAPVAPDRVPHLSARLAEIRRGLEARGSAGSPPPLPLGDAGTIHFARFVLLDEDAKGRPPCLVFGTDFDGTREAHRVDLASRFERGLSRIFEHCIGFPSGGGSREVLRFLRDHEVEPLCSYRGHPGRSVEQIQAERRLRDTLADHLDSLPRSPGLDARRACLERVEADPQLQPLLEEPPPTTLRRSEKVALTLRWAASNAGRIVRVLRRIERDLPALEAADTRAFHAARAAELAAAPPALAEMRRPLVDDEDLGSNNQLTTVTDLRPHPLRRDVLELVLSLANLRARTKFDQGHLSGIATIHFARWFLLEEPPGSTLPPRLVFFSNYGGSWESYLGDFVDQAGWKLSAIWTNTEDFPPTEDLGRFGARHERWFKEFVRRCQVPTQVWYAAYPDLSVSEINRNSRLRKTIRRGGSLAEREEWMRCL